VEIHVIGCCADTFQGEHVNRDDICELSIDIRRSQRATIYVGSNGKHSKNLRYGNMVIDNKDTATDHGCRRLIKEGCKM